MRPFLAAPGGTVGVFAPSSPFGADRFEAGLSALHALGHPTVVHPQARAKLGFLAGPDTLRLDALSSLVDDPGVAIVMAARGGYGLHRLLPGIDWERLAAAAKPLVGFSDVTALLLAAYAKAELVSVHGPVVTQLAELGADDRRVLVEVLAGRYAGLSYRARGPAITSGRARGPLLGGCLSVLVHLLGTPFMPSLDGAILLLEDVGEAPYRVDRMLTHLLLTGALNRVAGVALGDFVRCDPPREGEQTVEQVLAERLGALGVPVLSGLPFGHGSVNQAVPIGVDVELDASAGLLAVIGAR